MLKSREGRGKGKGRKGWEEEVSFEFLPFIAAEKLFDFDKVAQRVSPTIEAQDELRRCEDIPKI